MLAGGLNTAINEALLGRVRRILIHFQDRRAPLQISCIDPKMSNAQEIIEAIVYRMSEIGEVEAEMIEYKGKPLVRRIRWKGMLAARSSQQA
jgi:hypothetical protein